MGNMQYAILFKQRPQTLPSMIIFRLMTKIILYVQNMGFFDKKLFRGQRFFIPERGAIDGGWGQDSSFRVGGPLTRGGHWQGGGGVILVIRCMICMFCVMGSRVFNFQAGGGGGVNRAPKTGGGGGSGKGLN